MKFIEPTPVDVVSSDLTDIQVESWREQGFVLVDGLLPMDLVCKLVDATVSRFPAANSDEAAGLNDFGGGMTFPD